MELEQVLFQSAQDQGVICAALKSTLDLFADDEILGIETACQCASALSSVVFSRINIVCTRIATAQRRRLPSSQVSRGIWYRRCALISWRNLELYWPATHTSVGALL